MDEDLGVIALQVVFEAMEILKTVPKRMILGLNSEKT